ncbi:lysoplasmalogenase [Microbacterium sp. CIAB417]|uniref:lysoplasmalogenase n=1 Tax=Microbacterium sp. CIAB417 TaxID=2860287 RepID=UPI001FAB8D6D|nr:lysoplasmalogenase [Microbacterium sp. CIAB417]
MQRSVFGRPTIWWTFVPFALMSVLHVGALAVGSDLAGPTKLWLMPLLAIPVLISARLKPRLAIVLLLAALLFSWLGDGAGFLFPAAPELPLMLGFFGLAHVAYIVLFLRVLRRRRGMPWWALVYAVWWVAMIVILGPHTDGLLLAVGVYGLVLGATAALATRCRPLVTLGGAFFLVSDTILAFRLFLPDAMPDWTSPAVMATYTLGQGLIVAGALATLREGKTPR